MSYSYIIRIIMQRSIISLAQKHHYNNQTLYVTVQDYELVHSGANVFKTKVPSGAIFIQTTPPIQPVRRIYATG